MWRIEEDRRRQLKEDSHVLRGSPETAAASEWAERYTEVPYD